MKRNDLIKQLIKVGLTESTLVNFSDQQIFALSKRMLGEDVMISKKDPQFPQKVSSAKKQNKTIETYEELKGNQKKLDKNHNGKIDAQDFKILKGQKKKEVSEEKPSAGLSDKKKSEVVKKAIAGKDIGKKGKGFKEVEKKAKESGAKNPKAVAAAAMWKGQKNESVEMKNWVFNLLEKHYHPVATKKEIVDTIRRKINEQGAPATAPTKPVTKPAPTTTPKPNKPLRPKPKEPNQPSIAPDRAPKNKY